MMPRYLLAALHQRTSRTMGNRVSNERQQSTTLEQLPTEITTKIVELLDIPSRIKLALCNTNFQRRVYQECSQSWRVMSFADLPTALRQSLTDNDLSTLLVRVNARENTVKLNIACCARIDGDGLEPLTGSRVLEYVSCSEKGEYYDRDELIAILETMIPYKLSTVYLGYFGYGNQDVRGFMHRLRLANIKRAKEQRLLCSACGFLVMEDTRQVVLDMFNSPSHSCLQCSQVFCRRGSCPMNVRTCSACGKLLCDTCQKCVQCYSCGESHCSDCSSPEICNYCGKAQCEGCDVGIDRCVACDKPVCRDCGRLQEEDEVCSGDGDCLVCHGCTAVVSCDECNSLFCKGCDVFYQCQQCSKKFCNGLSCRREVARCGACTMSFCTACKEYELCEACDIYFCTDHHRFVDCKSCQIRHCRDCRCSNRCKFCGTSCYEDCVCDQRKPPAKKRKLMQFLSF